MASSLLARRISSSAASFSPLLRFRLYLSTKPQPEKDEELPFIAQYLISSFGFSPDRAIKLSTTRLGAIKSADRPEAMVQFLKGTTGLSDAQIKRTITRRPELLRYNAERSFKSNWLELKAQGFSQEVLIQLIEYNPSALLVSKTASRLLFWREFTGNNDETLLRILKKNRYLITFDVGQQIVPRMNLLKECGLSNQHIALMLGHGHSCMSRNLETLRQVIGMVENMGILRGSGMFFAGFRALINSSKDTIKKKKEFFKTAYGWSEQEMCTAFCKFPNIFQCSEGSMKSKMDFLIREVKLNPSRIAQMPTLLSFSIEKRLIPRHRVLSILEAKKLKEKCSFHTACTYSEKNFIRIYIEPYEKDAPELYDAYYTALGGTD